VVQTYGWGGFFVALMGACAVALALLATVANAPSYLQRREREEGGQGGAAKPALA
jgi:sugar phosphate permease